MEEVNQIAEDVWEGLSYVQKLAATSVVFDKIVEHSKRSETLRYLIYDRLGFDLDGYSELCKSGREICNIIHKSCVVDKHD